MVVKSSYRLSYKKAYIHHDAGFSVVSVASSYSFFDASKRYLHIPDKTSPAMR